MGFLSNFLMMYPSSIDLMIAEAERVSKEAVQIPDRLVMSGGVELFRTDLFLPIYQPMSGERWALQVVPLNLCAGYWGETRLVTNMTVLTRRDGDSVRTWMSITPMELESQEIGCRAATGETVVMGLGMGWAAANAALRPEVSRVTVVERDPEVIEFSRRNGVFDQLPAEAGAKVAVVEGDALTFVPDRPAETLLADIWLPLNGDDRVDQVWRMQANTGATRVYFWGQEMVIARRARDTGMTLDKESVARIVTEIGLPLIGPELPDYPDLIGRAAARWLADV
jgi:hypothetical protein